MITPFTDDMGEYVQWYYRKVEDKAPYVAGARAVHALVRELPHRPNDRDHALTEQHARQIRSFYTAFSLPEDQIWAYRDARAAAGRAPGAPRADVGAARTDRVRHVSPGPRIGGVAGSHRLAGSGGGRREPRLGSPERHLHDSVVSRRGAPRVDAAGRGDVRQLSCASAGDAESRREHDAGIVRELPLAMEPAHGWRCRCGLTRS